MSEWPWLWPSTNKTLFTKSSRIRPHRVNEINCTTNFALYRSRFVNTKWKQNKSTLSRWEGRQAQEGTLCWKIIRFCWGPQTWGWSGSENWIMYLLETELCIINSSHMSGRRVHSLGWSDLGCHFPWAGVCGSARPCSMSQVVPLMLPVQDMSPYQHPSHHSQSSGCLTLCLTSESDSLPLLDS